MTYRMARRIVVCLPGFKKMLVQRGVPEDKVDVIYNWTLENSIKRMERDEKTCCQVVMRGKFNIVFAGSMGKAQGLETEAADLRKEGLSSASRLSETPDDQL